MNDLVEQYLENRIKMIRDVLAIEPPIGEYDRAAYVARHKVALDEAVQHQLKCSYDVFAGIVKVYSFDNRVFIAALTEQDAIDFYVDMYGGGLLPTVVEVESEVLKERRLMIPVEWIHEGLWPVLKRSRYDHLHRTYNEGRIDYSLIPAQDILMQDWNGKPIVLWEEQA